MIGGRYDQENFENGIKNTLRLKSVIQEILFLIYLTSTFQVFRFRLPGRALEIGNRGNINLNMDSC